MEQQSYQSLFTYGAVGKSLVGFRDSSIAGQSADTLENFYISEMGTLKIAKKYEGTNIINSGNIIAKKDTKYNFFLVFTTNKIYSVHKETLRALYSHDITNGQIDMYSNINIFNDFVFTKYSNNKVDVWQINQNGQIGTTNFFDTLQLPFRQKQDVAFDVYKCFMKQVPKKDGSGYEDKITPELMTTFTKDGELKVNGNGEIFLKNSGVKIDRVYVQYKSLLSYDQLDGATNGMTLIVFKNYQEGTGNLSYHLGNTKISFTDRKTDSKYGSDYFTKATANTSGKLIFGVLENFITNTQNVVDIVEFQSRLSIATNEKIYFSKILEYENFVPSLENDAGFFIKPSVIDGNQPNITRMIVGNGLYVVCKEGIIVIGYGSNVSGTNLSNIKIAGNSRTTNMNSLIEDIFYYVDINGLLRAIIPNFQSGIINFSNVIVEKYDYEKKKITWIEKMTINEDNVLIVNYENTENVDVYSMVELGLFRRFALKLERTSNYILGYNNDYMSGTKYYKLTKKNVDKAKLVLNLPFIQTERGGVYLNDYLARYGRTVMNIYTPKKTNIKRVSVNDYPMQSLSTNMGNYSVYDFLGALPIIDLTITIEPSNNEDIIEIRGINGFIKT